MPKPTVAQYRRTARRMFNKTGEIYITKKASVVKEHRESEVYQCGAYVLAWVWVPISKARKHSK